MSELSDPLEAILEPVRVERDRLIAERNDLRARAAALDERVRRLDRVLKAAGADEPSKPKPRASSNGDKLLWRPRQDKLDAVLAFVLEHGEVSVKDVRDGLEVSPTTARQALEALRAEEKVRLSANSSARGGAMYAPMPS